ncbi:MAG: hypothetical protein Q4E09_05765 [Eubacteriales bacterium]|nr:hypothetical protein [Eubacteriales bacterium]
MRIDYFYPLEEENLSLFAPPGEVRLAAQSYNVALALYLEGNESQALARLRQISDDYPLFPQASHLYGVLLAGEGDLEAAYYYLERVSLLDIEDEERAHLEEELRQAKSEAMQLRRDRQRQAQREKMLTHVKREVARESILYKVSSDDEDEESSSDQQSSSILEDPEEKHKTIMTAIIAASVAVLMLLLFFFLWRPAIVREQERRIEQAAKLDWLETELQERAATSEDLARFYADYQAWQLEDQP